MSTPVDCYYKYYSLSGEQPKVIVWKANAVQDSDLLELPMDPKGYRYSHIVVDVSTQDLDGNPLKSKDAETVLDSFKRIYQRVHVKFPTFRLNTDTGKEFDNSLVRNYFRKEVKVLMKFGFPGKHRQQCFHMAITCNGKDFFIPIIPSKNEYKKVNSPVLEALYN
ncbi:14622_t:CDS:2 [Entrophospora sp. SA101]|nr:14622_t:CDS:2 [Entrophospora sp. SA101]